MTDEEKRIAIAKACGWIQYEDGWWNGQFNTVGQRRKSPPDYLNDLNAMHEAEEHLFATESKEAKSYSWQLEKIIERDWETGTPDRNWVCLYSGKAHQRAEAFLRTLNLW